jgi:hypothetical protein
MATYRTSESMPRAVPTRLLYAGLTATLIALVAAELAHRGGGYWWFAAFIMAPDLALFLGFGKGLEKGRLHPRAIPLYNLLHRFWGPVALGALAIATLIPSGFAIAALAWALHIALDRSIGYGLRTRDGFQQRS